MAAPDRGVLLTNLTNGTAAAAMFTSTFALAGARADTHAIIAAWIAACSAYFVFRPVHHSVRPLALGILLCALGYLHSWIAGHFPPSIDVGKKGMLYVLLILGFAAFLGYTPHLVLNRGLSISLRSTWFKNASIALTWTVFSMIPWMLAPPHSDYGLTERLLSRFLMLLALSIASDVPDASLDRGKLRTLAQQLGPMRTEIIVIVLLLLSLAVQGPGVGAEQLAMLAPVMAMALLFMLRNKWVREWILDGAIVLHALVLMIFYTPHPVLP